MEFVCKKAIEFFVYLKRVFGFENGVEFDIMLEQPPSTVVNGDVDAKANVKTTTRVPYLSFENDPFNFDTQLPIDEGVFDEDNEKFFDFESVTVQSLYREKKKIVAYLKSKYLNVSDKEVDVDEEIRNILKMRNRLLMGKSSFNAPLSIEVEVVTEINWFVTDLYKIEFFKHKNNIPHSYLYPDVNAFAGTLIDFMRDRSESFDFNRVYADKFNRNISKRQPQRIETKTLNDYPIAKKLNFIDRYNERRDAKKVAVTLNVDIVKNFIKDSIDNNLMETLEFPFILFDMNKLDSYDASLNNNRPKNRAASRAAAAAASGDIQLAGNYSLMKNLLNGKSIDVDNNNNNDDDNKRKLILVLSPKFNKCNDYLIYKLLFDGRRVPVNMGLVYYVLYAIANKVICEKSKKYSSKFKSYMFRRILATKCSIGLTTSEFFPQIRVPLLNAVFYSYFVSTRMFQNHPVHFYQERLKELFPYANSFYEILSLYCDYEETAAYGFLLRKFAATQRPEIIRWYESVDNDVRRVIKSSFVKSDRGYMIRSFEFDKPVNMLKKVFNFPVHLNKYVHSYYSFYLDVGKETIDRRTMRPRFVICKTPEKTTTYYDMLMLTGMDSYLENDGFFVYRCIKNLKNVKLDISKVVSFYKLYQNCVMKYKKFPTIDEYHLYVYDRCTRRKDDKICFFDENIVKNIDSVYDNYTDFIKTNNVGVTRFICAIQESERLVDRIRIEENGIDDVPTIRKIVDKSKMVVS
ncbi:p94 [Alphabaculovirus altersperidaniae]|uniref:P94 n=1 Tax=Spodoptera eridania nucleopolyhedrovirus TaxID=2315721 RepID=A0ABX6TQQ9_9ABAC|nr:p94 [Spodoptera eridania nucleopolyhedrovirus]QNV47825.1 p94 [Spodoptera eridania nucleopolyhedrovirus]